MGVVNRLKDLLPPTFEQLGTEFAVGVVDSQGRHRLVDSGPLPEAVAASVAIPYLFEPVKIPGMFEETSKTFTGLGFRFFGRLQCAEDFTY